MLVVKNRLAKQTWCRTDSSGTEKGQRMAEERTLGLARARRDVEEPSKEELQRRLDVTRDSISQTVTEIKETVANQVQAVKDTLDWREQFKKRPVAWSAGAFGVGFLVGYCVADTFKAKTSSAGITRRSIVIAMSRRATRRNRCWVSEAAMAMSHVAGSKSENGPKDHGPGFIEHVTLTLPLTRRMRDEAANFGSARPGTGEHSESGRSTGVDQFAQKLHRRTSAERSANRKRRFHPPSRTTQSKYEPVETFIRVIRVRKQTRMTRINVDLHLTHLDSTHV